MDENQTSLQIQVDITWICALGALAATVGCFF